MGLLLSHWSFTHRNVGHLSSLIKLSSRVQDLQSPLLSVWLNRYSVEHLSQCRWPCVAGWLNLTFALAFRYCAFLRSDRQGSHRTDRVSYLISHPQSTQVFIASPFYSLRTAVCCATMRLNDCRERNPNCHASCPQGAYRVCTCLGPHRTS